MSTEYIGVGGIGVKLTQEMINYAIDNEIFTNDDWDDDPFICLSKLNIKELNFKPAGNCFTGKIYFYILVKGETFIELIDNYPLFIEKIKEYFGVDIDISDLIVINAIYIY